MQHRSGACRRSATLVLGDGAELDGIVRAASRARGAVWLVSSLGRVAGGGVRVPGNLQAEPIPGAYVTVDGDVLDEICWRRYGREDVVPAILVAGARLVAAGPVLPAGVLVVLPELSAARSAI